MTLLSYESTDMFFFLLRCIIFYWIGKSTSLLQVYPSGIQETWYKKIGFCHHRIYAAKRTTTTGSLSKTNHSRCPCLVYNATPSSPHPSTITFIFFLLQYSPLPLLFITILLITTLLFYYRLYLYIFFIHSFDICRNKINQAYVLLLLYVYSVCVCVVCNSVCIGV